MFDLSVISKRLFIDCREILLKMTGRGIPTHFIKHKGFVRFFKLRVMNYFRNFLNFGCL